MTTNDNIKELLCFLQHIGAYHKFMKNLYDYEMDKPHTNLKDNLLEVLAIVKAFDWENTKEKAPYWAFIHRIYYHAIRGNRKVPTEISTNYYIRTSHPNLCIRIKHYLNLIGKGDLFEL